MEGNVSIKRCHVCKDEMIEYGNCFACSNKLCYKCQRECYSCHEILCPSCARPQSLCHQCLIEQANNEGFNFT